MRHLFLTRGLSFRLLLVVLTVSSLASRASAQPSLQEQIDKAITAHESYPKQPAAPAADGEFLRRIYLDFAGVIPPADEARAFLKDANPNKRQQLIDSLLDS